MKRNRVAWITCAHDIALCMPPSLGALGRDAMCIPWIYTCHCGATSMLTQLCCWQPSCFIVLITARVIHCALW